MPPVPRRAESYRLPSHIEGERILTGRWFCKLACIGCAVLVMTAGTGRAQNPADQELHARMSRLEESNERLLRQNGQLELEVGQLKAELHGGRDAPPNPQPNSVPVATGFNADLPRPPADPPLTETTPTQPVVQRPDSKAEAEAVDSNALDQKIQAAVGKLSWSKGDFKIVPFGWLEVQGVGATDSVTGRAVVNFVNPGSPVSQPEFNIFGQTSTLGVDIKGPEIFGLQAGGRILTVFVGDRPLLNQSTPLLVNGYGELVNEDWRFLFGTFFPIIAPLNPDSVAFAPGVAAGNLSVFRGQFRIERYWHLNDATQLTLQTGITQQVVNDFVPFAGLGAIGSDNGWPNVETRVALALGTQDQNTKERPVELGLGSVIGQLRGSGRPGTRFRNLGRCRRLAGRRDGLVRVQGRGLHGTGAWDLRGRNFAESEPDYRWSDPRHWGLGRALC